MDYDTREEFEIWWKKRLGQELTRQRYTLSQEIVFCVQEIRLALNRATPNIEMSNHRLDQIENCFKKLETRHES